MERTVIFGDSTVWLIGADRREWKDDKHGFRRLVLDSFAPSLSVNTCEVRVA